MSILRCKNFLSFFTFLLFFTTASIAQNPFRQGIKWYKMRAANADSFTVEPTNISRAIRAFEKAQEKWPSEQNIVLLLKSYYFKGMFTALSEGQKKEIYDMGRTVGEAAVEQYPQSAAVKFWYGANLGRWAESHGFLASATSGIAKKLRSLCRDIIDLDPDYQGGGGYRILAQVYFYAPKIPIIMGWPSDEKALELIKKAMGIAPNHPSNRLLFAEFLLNLEQKKKAKVHLNYLIQNMKTRNNHLVEDRFVKYRAKKLFRKYFGQKKVKK